MNLIISESTKAAWIQAEEWGEPALLESTYGQFSAWMTHCGKPFRLEIGASRDKIYLFFSTAADGSDTHRLELICDGGNRSELLQELADDHGLTPVEPVH